MRWNRLSRVIPVPGLDPGIVAGIHVFLADFQLEDVDGRDKPGHDSEQTVQCDRIAL
jgi:hypothetical protein